MPADRKLNLVDAMILSAGFALWFALIRATMPLGNLPPRLALVLNLAALILNGASALTFAWLAMRLRHPRPRIRRLARQPGFAACAVVAASTVAIGLTRLAIGVFQLGWINPDIQLMIATNCIGFAVVGSWITLALMGNWRPSAGWFDRTGRFLGGAWVLCLGSLWFLGVAFSF